MINLISSGMTLERSTGESDSLVHERDQTPVVILEYHGAR